VRHKSLLSLSQNGEDIQEAELERSSKQTV